MGIGKNCMYWSSNRRNYYMYAAPSFEAWFTDYLMMLNKNYYKRDKDGFILNWIDTEQLYKEYI